LLKFGISAEKAKKTKKESLSAGLPDVGKGLEREGAKPHD